MRVLTTGLVAFAIVSCADSTPSTTTASPPPSTAAPALTTTSTSIGDDTDPLPTTTATIRGEPSTLIGVWLWERGLGRPGVGGTGDSWVIEFSAELTFEARYSGVRSAFDYGTYQFDGRILELHSDPEATGSPCAGLSAIYTVVFLDADTLTMPRSEAEDECPDREEEMAFGNFLRTE